MENEQFKKGLGKMFNNTETPKIFGNMHKEAVDKRRNKKFVKPELNLKGSLEGIDKQVRTPPAPQKSSLHSNELQESINSLTEEKVRKEREAINRDKDKVRYLQNISDNTDYIVKQFKDTAMNLKVLNTLLEKSNMTLEDIRKDVEENKQVNFEVFELLAKERISNERDRLKATETLLNKLKDPLNSIDVSASITSILSVVISLMN